MEVGKYPGISIIIPAYNEEKALERTLLHFLPFKEKYNLEIIVADDASTDRTVEIAERFADKVVLNRTGRRARSGSCNRGVREANYGILFFLDADILVEEPDSLFSKVYEVFRDESVIGGMLNYKVYPDKEKFSDRVTHAFWNAVMRLVLKFGYGVSTPGIQIVKKAAFNRIGGYDENLRLIQDVDLFLRLSRIGKIRFFSGLYILESPRRYRDEGYLIYAYRSTLRWYNILFKHRSYGEYKTVR